MLPRVVWLVLCGVAEPGHYRERPHVFHQEAVVLEEAGGEGDGVVVHVGPLTREEVELIQKSEDNQKEFTIKTFL